MIERSASDAGIRLVPYHEAYAEGFEELGRRKPDTSALRGVTGWSPTRSIDDAIDDVIAFERGSATALHATNGYVRGNGRPRLDRELKLAR